MNLHAQVFNGATGPISVNGNETYFPIQVDGIQGSIQASFGLKRVCLDITHPVNQQLFIYLLSPGGIRVQLSDGNSVKDSNYTSTCFDDQGVPPISSGTAPYTGTFKPIGYLGRFNNGQNPNGTWQLIVKDYLAFADSGALNYASIEFANNVSGAINFSSTNLPLVKIQTNNQVIGLNGVTVDFGIIRNSNGARNYTNDPWNHYNGKAIANVRGHSTMDSEKQSFDIELRNSAGIAVSNPLLGMPTESDWVLIAQYKDKSLMRIPITYEFTRKMGDYAPRFRFVELMINGEYRGIYLLMEKIKRDKNRVNIHALNASAIDTPGVSGGYIFKIDRADSPGWTSLLPGNHPGNQHFYYNYDQPSGAAITNVESQYLQEYMNRFELAIDAQQFDTATGYQQYMDLRSMVDFLIVNEMSKNVDGYRLSTYFYKNIDTLDKKVHMGPVWDYDIAWHNCNDWNNMQANGWQYEQVMNEYPIPNWWNKAAQDTNFTNLLWCRWTGLRDSLFRTDAFYGYIDSLTNLLEESRVRNFQQFPIIGTYIFPNPQDQSTATYQTEVQDLKSWVASRCGWMDFIIAGHCPIVAPIDTTPPLFVRQLDASQAALISYPNPAKAGGMLTLNGLGDGFERYAWYDVLGQKVAEGVLASSAADLGKDLHCPMVPPGIYFVRLDGNKKSINLRLLIKN